MKKYIKKSIFIGIFSIIGIMGTGNKLYAEQNFRQWYADDKTEKIETELEDVYSNPSHARLLKKEKYCRKEFKKWEKSFQ